MKNCCKRFSEQENNNVIYVVVKAKDWAEKQLYYRYYIRIHRPGEEYADHERIHYCPFCGGKLDEKATGKKEA